MKWTGCIKRWFRSYKYFVYCVIFAIIFTFLVYGAAIFFSDNPFNLRYVGDVGSWIGYSGAVFGGSITILAILMDRKLGETRDSKVLRPTLKIVCLTHTGEFIEYLEEPITLRGHFIGNDDCFPIYLSNVSSNSAKIVDSKVEINLIGNNGKVLASRLEKTKENLMKDYKKILMLQPGETRKTEIDYPIEDIPYSFNIFVEVLYEDILGLKTHKLSSKISIDVTSKVISCNVDNYL